MGVEGKESAIEHKITFPVAASISEKVAAASSETHIHIANTTVIYYKSKLSNVTLRCTKHAILEYSIMNLGGKKDKKRLCSSGRKQLKPPKKTQVGGNISV